MPTSTSFTARLYLFPLNAVFARLRRFYAADNAENLGGLEMFVIAYRNSLLTILGQLELFPQVRPLLVPALLASAQSTGSFDGLESVFFTLLNAAAASGDNQTFTSLMAQWGSLGTITSSPAAGNIQSYDPVLFYNVTDKNLTYLTLDALSQLRPGGQAMKSSPSRLALETLLRNWVSPQRRLYSLAALRQRLGGRRSLAPFGPQIHLIRLIQR